MHPAKGDNSDGGVPSLGRQGGSQGLVTRARIPKSSHNHHIIIPNHSNIMTQSSKNHPQIFHNIYHIYVVYIKKVYINNIYNVLYIL